VGIAAIAVILGACAGAGDDDLAARVVENYASLVHESYQMSLDSAVAMDAAIDVFLEAPSAETLEQARQAWLDARDDYSPTEAFRFYGGPIDDAETGVEGLVNAWPLDEAYLDYVEGDPGAGVINDSVTYPEIDTELLVTLNEQGGEANISTGWHAIEFLLWGQDLTLDGPGSRSFDDYVSAPNAERRRLYLSLTSDLLVEHLGYLVEAWAPDADNYRAGFVALPSEQALGKIITGMGELSRGELAGERMTVAFQARSQEDEHSCFSDNTTNDIIGNALGIQRVYLGEAGGVDGPGIYELVAAADQDLADRLRDEIAASVESARAIPAPFDVSLAEGVSDDDPGRVAIADTISGLEVQADTIVAAATILGVEINLS
jgi:putative iron-regulated protein